MSSILVTEKKKVALDLGSFLVFFPYFLKLTFVDETPVFARTLVIGLFS